jgi:hypothetical protein
MLWEDTFYESGQDIATRIMGLAQACSPEFISSLAIKARGEYNLRHVPQLLMATLAEMRVLKAETVTQVIQRPDDMMEFLALFWKGKKKPIMQNQMRKGLAAAFGKFDLYSLAKNQKRGHKITLKDVASLVHPDPRFMMPWIAERGETAEEREEAFALLKNNDLPMPSNTWEVKLSEAQTPAEKKQVWDDLLNDEALGAMALIRNLRNMDKVGVSEAKVRKALKAANTRRVMPFRFLSAAIEAPSFVPELDTMFLKACEGIEPLGGHSVICVDTSGSMGMTVSEKSKVSHCMVGACIAAILREICDQVTVLQFASTCRKIPSSRGLQLPLHIRDHIGEVGHGTDIAGAVAAANRLDPDRVIVVSDMQSHTSVGGPRGHGYMLNVAAYQNSIAFGPWVEISGFSDAVVKFLCQLERENLG